MRLRIFHELKLTYGLKCAIVALHNFLRASSRIIKDFSTLNNSNRLWIHSKIQNKIRIIKLYILILKITCVIRIFIKCAWKNFVSWDVPPTIGPDSIELCLHRLPEMRWILFHCAARSSVRPISYPGYSCTRNSTRTHFAR